MKYLIVFSETVTMIGMMIQERQGSSMDFLDKLTGTITTKGQEAVDKAKELAEITRLRNQISSCEEVIRKNYLEIGKLVYEAFEQEKGADDRQTRFQEIDPQETLVTYGTCMKQFTAIANAKRGIKDLENQIRAIREK